MFYPWHLGVKGNERADELAGSAVIGQQMALDPPLMLAHVKEDIYSKHPESTSNTLFDY